MNNKNKVILITGTSSGIGKACFDHLTKRGYIVFGTSRKVRLHEKDNEVQNILHLDVTDDKLIKNAIDYITSNYNKIDVLVNNAGFAIAGSLEDTSLEEARSQLETNFWGPVRLCKAVIPIMREKKGGLIVNISSFAGIIALPFQAYYCASKYALEGMTEALRIELKPYNIHVSLIEPGDIHTDITKNRLIVSSAKRESVYRETFNNALNVIENGEQRGEAPLKVARLLEKIIISKKPRLRYSIGNVSDTLAYRLNKVTPRKLYEKMVMRYFNINKTRSKS
jgi:short-subunit dehydrogenase